MEHTQMNIITSKYVTLSFVARILFSFLNNRIIAVDFSFFLLRNHLEVIYTQVTNTLLLSDSVDCHQINSIHNIANMILNIPADHRRLLTTQ